MKHESSPSKAAIDLSVLTKTAIDGFEVHPCVLLDEQGDCRTANEVAPDGEHWCYEQCDENNPNIAVWSVYGHTKQGLECLSDHATKAEAEAAMSVC